MLASSRSDRGKLKPRILKIHILRNGDSSFKGTTMRLQPNNYDTFEDFLVDVTNVLKRSVFVNIGGVRSLYYLNGTKVTSCEDLTDNENYVAACRSEQFKNVPYIQAQRPSSPMMSRESIYSSTSTRTVGDLTQSDAGRGKRVTIIRGGNRPRKIFRVVLNSRNTHNFDRVLTVINEAAQFDSAPLHILFTVTGKPVTDMEDVFGYHFIFFAFRKECSYYVQDLELSEEEVQRITQLNKTPGSDNITLTVPPLREPSERMILPQIALKYNLGRTIGTGNFSTVSKCSVKMSQDKGVRYAIKIVNKNRTNYKSIQEELHILKGLRHPKIVTLFYIHDSRSEVYLIYELLDRDLHSLLNNDKIEEGECRVFIENLFSALFYIHCLKIVHRGVRPTNLMVTSDGSGKRIMKLIDFGLACKTFKPLYEICGDTFFLAPEMLRREGYGNKVDIWAAGVVLYYMLSKTPPFLGCDEDEDKELILKGKYDLVSPEWKRVTGGAKHIIGRMLCQNVAKRYSAEQVLSHPWITGDGFDECGNWEEGKRDREQDSTDKSVDSDAVSVVDLYMAKKSKGMELSSDFESVSDGHWDDESIGEGDDHPTCQRGVLRATKQCRYGAGEGTNPQPAKRKD